MADSNKRSKRHALKQPFDPSVFEHMQEDMHEIEEHRLDHEEPEHAVWIYLPFKKGQQEDQRKMAESFIRERTLDNPRKGKRYRLVEHTGAEGGLEDVQPGDTVYMYAHGAELDTNHIYTHDGQGQLSVNGLVNQMLGVEKLDPTNVKFKLGNCYSATTEHQTKDNALGMETYTSNFAQTLSEKSLKQGKGLPQYVDGYIGSVQNQSMIVSEDGKRHRGANMPSDKAKLRQIQMLEFMNPHTETQKQEAAELTAPYRAKDNRWRYNVQQTGNESVQVSLNEAEFDRITKLREEREQQDMEQFAQSMGEATLLSFGRKKKGPNLTK